MKNGDSPAVGCKTFEVVGDEQFDVAYTGLTKRELFAAMAMQGYCSDPDINESMSVCADSSVRMADALLKRLEE